MATHFSIFAWEVPWTDGVAKNRTQLSNFTLTFHFDALEKEMATHSSVLAWRIPGLGEPGGLPSMMNRVALEEVSGHRVLIKSKTESLVVQ